MHGGVLLHYALVRRLRNAIELAIRKVQRRLRLIGVAGDQDLAAGLEELLDSLPVIAQERDAARRSLEQTSGRTEAHGSHLCPRDVQGQP